MSVLLTAWAVTVGLGWWWLTRMPALHRRVLINCPDDTAIRGVLIGGRGQWLVVQQAELLRTDGPPVALDGTTLVLRSRVIFLQVLP